MNISHLTREELLRYAFTAAETELEKRLLRELEACVDELEAARFDYDEWINDYH